MKYRIQDSGLRIEGLTTTKRHNGSLGRCSPMDYEATWKKLPLPEDRQRVEVIRSESTPDFSEASLQSNAIDTSCQYPYCTIHLN